MRFDREREEPEIPTSSMADIAFLLIIYFMVTTTFAATRGLDFALPEEQDNPPQIEKEESILIEIQADGSYMVDQQTMELSEILEYVEPKLEVNQVKPVIIRPQPDAPYSAMVDVFDELRQAPEKIGMEIKNISIPTRREIDQFWY